jgi:hypothetical protein
LPEGQPSLTFALGELAAMKKIPTICLALIAGIVLELVLLTAGGFDLRVGGEGPASMLLFITHLPATFICGALPLAWQTATAVMVANGILLSGLSFIVIFTKRAQWAD